MRGTEQKRHKEEKTMLPRLIITELGVDIKMFLLRSFYTFFCLVLLTPALLHGEGENLHKASIAPSVLLEQNRLMIPDAVECLQVDLNLTPETAVKIAEIILVKKFGEHVLRERPWQISTDKEKYIITGQKPNAMHWRGGLAEIIIRKKDAKVLSISHGR